MPDAKKGRVTTFLAFGAGIAGAVFWPQIRAKVDDLRGAGPPVRRTPTIPSSPIATGVLLGGPAGSLDPQPTSELPEQEPGPDSQFAEARDATDGAVVGDPTTGTPYDPRGPEYDAPFSQKAYDDLVASGRDYVQLPSPPPSVPTYHPPLVTQPAPSTPTYHPPLIPPSSGGTTHGSRSPSSPQKAR